MTADMQNALELHNKYREEVGSPKLVWDPELAKSAQAWADKIAFLGVMQHDPNTNGQGENLATQSGGTNTYFTNAAQLWLNEKSIYDGKPIKTTGTPNYKDYGHYTQCVWKKTTSVGFAIAKGGNTYYVVARYSPQGNM
ncbi:hypothetical protein EsH8_IX_000934 [Colletotrichum jinshuiense]